MKPRISLCIPTWEQHGVGLIHLKRLIHSIESQTFDNYEIIISDHSKNDEIQKFLESVNNLKIRYYKNNIGYGNFIINTNNSIQYAEGELVKLVYQDDMLYSNDSLSQIDINFDENTNWMVVGCNHTTDGQSFYNRIIPHWNDSIIYGVNTIGSPSVLIFRNKNKFLFDERLTMLMDTEYFYRLYNTYGPPKILPDTLITHGSHKYQVSAMYTDDLNEEIIHVKNKHNL